VAKHYKFSLFFYLFFGYSIIAGMVQDEPILHRIPKPTEAKIPFEEYHTFVLRETIPALARELEAASSRNDHNAKKELMTFIKNEIQQGLLFIKSRSDKKNLEEFEHKDIVAGWRTVLSLTSLFRENEQHDETFENLFARVNMPFSTTSKNQERFLTELDIAQQKHQELLTALLKNQQEITQPTSQRDIFLLADLHVAQNVNELVLAATRFLNSVQAERKCKFIFNATSPETLIRYVLINAAIPPEELFYSLVYTDRYAARLADDKKNINGRMLLTATISLAHLFSNDYCYSAKDLVSVFTRYTRPDQEIYLKAFTKQATLLELDIFKNLGHSLNPLTHMGLDNDSIIAMPNGEVRKISDLLLALSTQSKLYRPSIPRAFMPAPVE
jgi:hypothetical protein